MKAGTIIAIRETTVPLPWLSVEDGFPITQYAQGAELAVEPVMFRLLAQFPLPYLIVVGAQPSRRDQPSSRSVAAG